MTEDFTTQMQDRLWQEIDTLKDQLTAAQAAHAKAHEEAADWRRLYTEKMTKVAELELAFSACEDTATEARFAQEQAEAERDAARAELLRLKRLLESLPAGLLSEYAEAQDG